LVNLSLTSIISLFDIFVTPWLRRHPSLLLLRRLIPVLVEEGLSETRRSVSTEKEEPSQLAAVVPLVTVSPATATSHRAALFEQAHRTGGAARKLALVRCEEGHAAHHCVRCK